MASPTPLQAQQSPHGSDAQNQPHQTLTFLDLPSEIRMMVYAHLQTHRRGNPFFFSPALRYTYWCGFFASWRALRALAATCTFLEAEVTPLLIKFTE
jgi:hypothetical protein